MAIYEVELILTGKKKRLNFQPLYNRYEYLLAEEEMPVVLYISFFFEILNPLRKYTILFL